MTARLVVFADSAGNVCGHLAMDQSRVTAAVVARLRMALTEGSGVAPDRFMVSATHAHNVPPLALWREEDTLDLLDRVCAALPGVARRAMAALTPVRLRAGRIDAHRAGLIEPGARTETADDVRRRDTASLDVGR